MDYINNLPHESDCAVHNMPAYPAGPCTCRRATTLARVEAMEAFVEAFRAWKEAEGAVDRIGAGATLTAAYARLKQP